MYPPAVHRGSRGHVQHHFCHVLWARAVLEPAWLQGVGEGVHGSWGGAAKPTAEEPSGGQRGPQAVSDGGWGWGTRGLLSGES